jgi:tetratricopeptide (TPR) repeat protein
MDILESIFTLIETNFLDIITILWIVWFTGVAFGLVVTTVSSCRTWRARRTLAKLGQRYEHARRRGEGAVQFDLDLERIRDTLTQREAELGEDAERMGLDLGVLGVLENFRGRIQQRLADLPGTYEELKERLQDIYVALNDFKDLCGKDQVALARLALKRGATGKAAALLKRVRSLGNQQIAEASGYQFVIDRNQRLTAHAAFLLGQLAETDFNYFTATQYYQLAADMEPSNLEYLKAAAELSYAFEELHETGHLLEQVLKIQEKLLGPEHLDLTQTLNNLGVLRHTEGRHREAEAFYLWALEICEANLHSQDQEAVNLVQNYATFLQDLGRCPEANAVKARAALA